MGSANKLVSLALDKTVEARTEGSEDVAGAPVMCTLVEVEVEGHDDLSRGTPAAGTELQSQFHLRQTLLYLAMPTLAAPSGRETSLAKIVSTHAGVRTHLEDLGAGGDAKLPGQAIYCNVSLSPIADAALGQHTVGTIAIQFASQVCLMSFPAGRFVVAPAGWLTARIPCPFRQIARRLTVDVHFYQGNELRGEFSVELVPAEVTVEAPAAATAEDSTGGAGEAAAEKPSRLYLYDAEVPLCEYAVSLARAVAGLSLVKQRDLTSQVCCVGDRGAGW